MPVAAGGPCGGLQQMIDRSLARFHFLAGLPRSGLSLLVALLAQNPRFVARLNGPAAAVFDRMRRTFPPPGEDAPPDAPDLSDGQRVALWRSALDAVHHDRPFGATVFDASPAWPRRLPVLAELYPLCRLIFCVRNPAQIVNAMLDEEAPLSPDDAAPPETRIARLAGPDSPLATAIADLRALLSWPQAERVLVLDYDRLVDDPEEAMEVIYDFLRAEPFDHDFRRIGGAGRLSGPVRRSARPMVLPSRSVLQLSGQAFWRNPGRTRATLLLGNAA